MKRIVFIMALLLLASFVAARPTTNIDVELKETEPTPLKTSEYADVWLEVTNSGNTAAEGVNVRFMENYPFSVDRGEKTNWSLGELVPGEEYQIHLQAKVDENAIQGENKLKFEAENSGFSVVEKVPVEVRSDRNVLTVRNIDFPEKVAPGSSGQMSLKLENLADSQLKNIEVKLDVSKDSLPFATSDSSSQNIEKVEPGESISLNYTLNVDEAADNAVYKLPIDISFENEAGTEFDQSATTGINVGGTPDLQTGLNTEEALKSGTTQEITLRLVNQGYGSADFVSMEIQENQKIEVIGSNSVYIGSMDADDFQTASFQTHISGDAENLEIPVELSYSDRDGQKTVERTIKAELYTSGQLNKYGIGSGGSLLPIVLVALLVVAGGAYYWRRKRRE